MTLQNTEGYTQEQLDALNAEFAERWESGYYDWIGTDDEAMDQAEKGFSDEVARRRAGAILGSARSPKKTAAARINAKKGGYPKGRPRQMTAEETALFIEEQSERLCIEHLGYTPATWYQGGPGHNDDRLEAMITACGDIRVTDGVETKFCTGSRTRPAVRRFVEDWLENLWDEKLEGGA